MFRFSSPHTSCSGYLVEGLAKMNPSSPLPLGNHCAIAPSGMCLCMQRRRYGRGTGGILRKEERGEKMEREVKQAPSFRNILIGRVWGFEDKTI